MIGPYLPELGVLGVEVGGEHGLAVGEEGVVRGEEHAARDAVGVEHVVEGVGRHRVQRHRVRGVAVRRAPLLQLHRVLEIQRRVDAISRCREVVQTRIDLCTARSPHGVRTCTHAPIDVLIAGFFFGMHAIVNVII